MTFEWKTAQIVCRSTDDEYVLTVWLSTGDKPDAKWFVSEIPSGMHKAQGTAPDADGAKAAAEIAYLKLKEAA